MVKDEDPFLAEWVEFHLNQGVEKIYIYDNGSKNSPRKILDKYIKENKVDVTDWTDIKTGRHVRAMNHCLNRKDIKTTWMMLTDIDEFTYVIDRKLSEWLKGYEKWDSVKIKWLGYGANGHVTRPKGSVLENYTMRGKPGDLPGGKSIVKFGIIKAMRDPHNPKDQTRKIQIDKGAWINHYVCRSEEDWEEKCRKGGGNGRPRVMKTFKQIQGKLNKIEDKRIQKWI